MSYSELRGSDPVGHRLDHMADVIFNFMPEGYFRHPYGSWYAARDLAEAIDDAMDQFDAEHFGVSGAVVVR